MVNTLCWGAGLIIVKPAFAITTPFRFLLYRYFFASLLSLPILFHYLPKKNKYIKHLPIILFYELIGTTLALSLLYIGLNMTSAIEASLIGTTTPIFISIAGLLILKEKIKKNEWLGLSLSFIATIVLTLYPFLNNIQHQAKISLFGNFLIILQNIIVALYYIGIKTKYKKLPKFLVTTISYYIGLVSFLILSFYELNTLSFRNLIQIIYSDFQSISVWIASLYMAIFGSIIGLTAYIKGQEKIEASEASLFTYLQPLIYIPLGIILLNEKISLIQIASIITIILGLIVAERKNH